MEDCGDLFALPSHAQTNRRIKNNGGSDEWIGK